MCSSIMAAMFMVLASAASLQAFASDAKREEALDFYQSASTHFLASRWAAAIEDLKSSLSLDPKQLRATRLLGICYQLTNDLDGAEKAFLQASRLDPQDPENWFFLGRVYYVRNLFDRASQALNEARRLDPKNVRVRECLALTFEALGDTDGALAEYAEAIRWNTRSKKPSSTPHLNYGVLLHKLNRIGESEAQLKIARDIDPKDWQAHFELGKLYYAMGTFEAAVRELEIAVRVGTAAAEDAARGCRLLAQAYYRLGRDKDARDALTTAQRLKP